MDNGVVNFQLTVITNLWVPLKKASFAIDMLIVYTQSRVFTQLEPTTAGLEVSSDFGVTVLLSCSLWHLFVRFLCSSA